MRIFKSAIVALSLLGMTSAYAVPVFTVDPFNAFGGANPGAFQADFISGNSSSLIVPTGGGNLHGVGYISLNTFSLGGNPILAGISGLNSTYQLFATYSYDSHLNSGTLFQNGSTYVFDSLAVTFYADPSIGSPTTFVQGTALGVAPLVTLGAGSVVLGTASLIEGVASINALGGSAANTTNALVLNALGESLFTAPNPFFSIQLDEFNNTSQGVIRGTYADGQQFLVTNQVSAGVDFQQVPEPGMLALMGLGLLSLGFISRRKH